MVRARVLGVFFADVLPAVAFFALTFLLATVRFFDTFLDEDDFEVFFFFEAPFFETLFGRFFADALRAADFFPVGRFLGVRVDIRFRDPVAAVFFLLPDFRLLLAAAFFAGIASRLQARL